MVFIYTLELANSKYYVGKTNNPKFRLDAHFNCRGSAWTSMYKPIKLLEFIDGDDYDEDKYTLKYMDNYGMDHVRGGSYSKVTLTKEDKSRIVHQLRTCRNQCYRCGSYSHFVQQCDSSIPQNMCFRCGRAGHLAENCYAKSHVDKKSMNACYRCGRKGHWRITCNETIDIYGRKTKDLCVIM